VRRPLTRLVPRTGTGALGGPLVHLDETGSTNDHARELALGGAPHGTAVLAEHQTAGRGRQGRTWTAPPGRALTLSVLARLPQAQMELLPLAVALAVCDACEAAADVRCEIKWPNDVWIEGRKVAGVLIEARPHEGWAVVGIGVNVDTAADELPPELRDTATSLRIATDSAGDRDAALDALFARLAHWVGALASPESVTAAFRERDALYGRRITWTQDARTMSGEARGIDDDGLLVVFAGEDEPVRLDAGEVHLETRA
jgi:BirA family biotin operon repressor/biotin-[acetyl-CoA-carboxylase] ligase